MLDASTRSETGCLPQFTLGTLSVGLIYTQLQLLRCAENIQISTHTLTLSPDCTSKDPKPSGHGSLEGPGYLSLIVFLMKEAHMPAKFLPHSFAKLLDSSLIITSNRQPGKCLSHKLTLCRA